VNDKVADPPLLATEVLVDGLLPSPQLTVPLRESFASAVQANVAITLRPARTLVGAALKVQLGAVEADTVIAIDAGVTVPARMLVVSVTVALIESVGLLAVLYLCANDKITEPPVAVPLFVELLDPSPQFTVPLKESLAVAVQVSVAITV
jgi:hypothetical protein